jgi:3-isopropylmalate dehydratase small subunit
MKPVKTIVGVAAPLLRDDINTDQIIPVAWVRQIDADLGKGLFGYWRAAAGEPFVLDRPEYASSRILVAGENFGCGSSREHAAWALQRFGIECVVARSFADQFRENCLKNGLLLIRLAGAAMDGFAAEVLDVAGRVEFTVDLERQTITSPAGGHAFEIEPHARLALLEGLDEIGLTLKHEAQIAAYEAKVRKRAPFLQTMKL